MIGERIKLARKRAGLSLRDLAEKMNGIVSAQAIGKYERGEMTPSSDVLIALSKSLDASIDYLLSSSSIKLGEIAFRKSNIRSKERAQVESEVLSGVERYLQIEEVLSVGDSAPATTIANLEVAMSDVAYGVRGVREQAEELANSLRKKWELGLDPIPNVAELLEEKGFKVILADLAEKVSGLSCWFSRENLPDVSAIVVNRRHSLERRRFTMLHELGHQLIEREGSDDKELERACDRFAGAFLVNAQHLRKEIGEFRSSFSYREIMDLKRNYGVSAWALIMRLEQVGLIEEEAKQYMFRTIAKDWRKSEPEPLESEEERGLMENPNRFERLVFRALAEDMISPMKAAELLRRSIDDIEEGLKGPDRGDAGCC